MAFSLMNITQLINTYRKYTGKAILTMEKFEGRGIYHSKKITVCIDYPNISSHFDWVPWIQVEAQLEKIAGFELTVKSNKNSMMTDAICDFLVDDIRINPLEDDQPYDNPEIYCKRMGDYFIYYKILMKNGNMKLDKTTVKVRHIECTQ